MILLKCEHFNSKCSHFTLKLHQTADFYSNLLVSWELVIEGYGRRPVKFSGLKRDHESVWNPVTATAMAHGLTTGENTQTQSFKSNNLCKFACIENLNENVTFFNENKIKKAQKQIQIFKIGSKLFIFWITANNFIMTFNLIKIWHCTFNSNGFPKCSMTFSLKTIFNSGS